jgi:hypothetical protein
LFLGAARDRGHAFWPRVGDAGIFRRTLSKPAAS